MTQFVVVSFMIILSLVALSLLLMSAAMAIETFLENYPKWQKYRASSKPQVEPARQDYKEASP